MSKPRVRKGFLLLIILLTLLITTVLSIRELSRRDIVKGFLIKKMEDILQREVEISRVRIALFPELAIEGEGIEIKEGEGQPLVYIKKLSLNLDLLALLAGRPTLGELTITEPTTFLVMERDGRKDLFRSIKLRKDLGITTFFIKKVSLTGGRLFFKDNIQGKTPLSLELRKISFTLGNPLFKKGLEFKLFTEMLHRGIVSKIGLDGRVTFLEEGGSIYDAFWIVEGNFDSLDPGPLTPYLGELINLNISRGTLKGDFSYRGSLSKGFSLFGSIDSSGLEVSLPQYYSKPISPEKARVFYSLVYERDLLDIKEFELGLDDVNFKGDLKVFAPFLDGGTLEGHFNSSWFSLPWLSQYLPDGAPGLPNFPSILVEYTIGGKGKIKNALFKGKIDDFFLPPSNEKKPVTLDLTLQDLSLKLKNDLPHLSNVSGELLLEGDRVSLQGIRGMYGNVPIKRLTGEVVDIFSPHPQVDLTFSSSLNLKDLDSFLSSHPIPVAWRDRLSSFKDWEGMTETDVNLKLTLGMEERPQTFRVRLSFTDVGFRYEGVNLPFKGIKGLATITDLVIESRAEGLLGNSSIELKGFVSGYNSGDPEFEIEGEFRGIGTDITNLLPPSSFKDVTLNGLVSGNISASNRLGKTILKTYIDLTSLGYGFKEKVFKPKGLMNFLEVEGNYKKPEGLTISSATYKLNGEEINLKGDLEDLDKMRGHIEVNLKDIKISRIKEAFPFLSAAPIQGMIKGKVSLTGSFLQRDVKAKGTLKLLDLALDLQPGAPPIKNLTADILFDEANVDIPYLFIHRGESIVKVNAKVEGLKHPKITFALSSPNLRKDDFPPNEFIRSLVSKLLTKASVKGELKIDQGRWNSVDFSSLKADISFKDGGLSVSPLEVSTGGSRIKGGLERVFLGDKGYRNILNFTLVKGDAKKIIRDWLKKEKILTGILDAKVNLTWEGKDKEEILKTLRGTLNTRFQDGRVFRLFEVLPKLLTLLNPLRIITLDLTEFEDQGMIYKDITGDFVIDNKLLTTDNLVINGKEMRILWVGNIDISTVEIDSVMAVQPFETVDKLIGETVGRLPLIGTIIVGRDRKFLVLYYKVQGDLRDPEVKGMNLEEVAKGVVDRLRILLLQPGDN